VHRIKCVHGNVFLVRDDVAPDRLATFESFDPICPAKVVCAVCGVLVNSEVDREGILCAGPHDMKEWAIECIGTHNHASCACDIYDRVIPNDQLAHGLKIK
jgi:hypothetical protein